MEDGYTITTDAHLMEEVFKVEIAAAPVKAAAITQRNGQRLLQMVQAFSPYRTGEYRESHQISLLSTGGTYLAEIYTDLPRGMMLEFGGDQLRSNGTTVHRQARPHYRPAFEFTSALYVEELIQFMTL